MVVESKPTILLISVILCVWGLYNFDAFQSSGLWLSAVCASVGLVGGASLALKRSWSQYLVYLASLLVVGGWAYFFVAFSLDHWPYDSLRLSILSLIPAALLLVVAVGSSYLVYRHFNSGRSAT